MVGHETTVVQDNQTNLQQGAEVERLDREEEKLKNEENEVKEMLPVKQQVVQNGGNDQTAGMGTKTDAPVTAQTIQAQNVTFQGLGDLRGSLFSVKGFEEAVGCKIEELPPEVSKLGKLLDEYSHLIDSPEARTGQNREDIIKTLEDIQRCARSYLKNPKPSESGVIKVGNRRIDKKSGKASKAQLKAQLKLKENLNPTLGTLQNECRLKIKSLKAGESVIPPQKKILPTSGPVTTPGKPLQQVTVQSSGSFSKKEFQKSLKGGKLPKRYQEIGTLLDQYGRLLNQGQNQTAPGRALLIQKLNEIVKLTDEYRIKEGSEDEKVAIAMGEFRRLAMEKIEGFKKGNPDPYYGSREAAKRTSGQLPMPRMKPVAQPTKQTKIAKPVVAAVKKEETKPVVAAVKKEETKPVVAAVKQEETKPVGKEGKKEETKPVVDEGKKEETKPVGKEGKQEEKTQKDIQQPNKEKEPEITGPSMRKDFLDVMMKSADGAGNADYKKLIGKFKELYQLLGDPITKENQEKSWKNLQKAYGELAAWSEWYAKAYTNAPTAISRVCRRQARMLMLMCSFDMRTLRIANSDPKLAEKNTTWRQILEQPAAPATQQTQTQQATTKDAAQTNQAKGDPARDVRNWERTLSESEKGGLGRKNSQYFNRVMDALEQTAKAMEQGFDRNSMNNIKKLSEASVALRELLTACQAYTARNPRTQSGKIRRDLVLQIQKYASRDSIGCEQALSEFITLAPEEQAKETWMSVIQRARSVQMTVKDLSKLAPEKKGQASEVFKIESREGNKTVAKYFKKEDSMDMDVVKKKGVQASLEIALQQTLEKFPDLSDKDKKLLKKLEGNPTDYDLEQLGISQEGTEAGQYMVKRMRRLNENVVDGYVKHIGIVDEGGTANMTRRNVATSRIADLLGLGKLVAKSRTVEIHDEATGKNIRGNLMDQAKGEELGKVKAMIKNNDITSGYMRDLTNLQVLDVLCGQVDRNGGNMMYQTEGGKVSGLQAIDNDASFGTNKDVVSAIVADHKDGRVFDTESGEMVLPYMDDGLAQRIENLNSDMVRYVLADLLKEEEIKAFLHRLDKMKEGIQKARKEHPERFLKSENEWTLSKTGQSQEENDSSVEGAFMKKFYEERGMYNRAHWEASDMIKSTAREMFKDDPKTLEAILLFEEDPKKFKELYDDKKEKKEYFMEKRQEVINKNRSFLQTKHWANQNYIGKSILSGRGQA